MSGEHPKFAMRLPSFQIVVVVRFFVTCTLSRGPLERSLDRASVQVKAVLLNVPLSDVSRAVYNGISRGIHNFTFLAASFRLRSIAHLLDEHLHLSSFLH